MFDYSLPAHRSHGLVDRTYRHDYSLGVLFSFAFITKIPAKADIEEYMWQKNLVSLHLRVLASRFHASLRF